MNFAQSTIFSGLMFFNEPELFYYLKKKLISVGSELYNLGLLGEHINQRPPRFRHDTETLLM